MRRLIPVAALVIVAAVAVAFLATRKGEQPYRVRAIFDNAGFVIPGEDVKVAGVKVGKIEDLDVTPDFKAAVVLRIDDPGYQDFRRDATCQVRPQSLIGERFVECAPTEAHPAGQQPPPKLRRIASGPGKGQYLLPVDRTQRSVDLDLINDIMRKPYAERLSLILNELGTGVAGRGKDLNAVIRRADPALKETDRVLQILGEQNRQLQDLAVNSDTVLAPLARDRGRVASAIRNSSAVGEATAERRADLERNLQKLPPFLTQLKPTMRRLGALSDEMTPVLSDLGDQAPAINRVLIELGPFSQAAIPAFDSLGEASKAGTPAVIQARPVIGDLRTLAGALRPVGATAAAVLESFQRTRGVERLMDYVFYQVAAINGFDSFGHYLRAGLIVNSCSSYTIDPVPGCEAKFESSASAASAGTTGAPRDPILKATADTIARALRGDFAKAKAKANAAAGTASGSPQRPAASNGGAATDGGAGSAAADAATPAAAGATPAPSVSAPVGGSEPAPTAPSGSPAPALLDYLFGKDGQ